MQNHVEITPSNPMLIIIIYYFRNVGQGYLVDVTGVANSESSVHEDESVYHGLEPLADSSQEDARIKKLEVSFSIIGVLLCLAWVCIF